MRAPSRIIQDIQRTPDAPRTKVADGPEIRSHKNTLCKVQYASQGAQLLSILITGGLRSKRCRRVGQRQRSPRDSPQRTRLQGRTLECSTTAYSPPTLIEDTDARPLASSRLGRGRVNYSSFQNECTIEIIAAGGRVPDWSQEQRWAGERIEHVWLAAGRCLEQEAIPTGSKPIKRTSRKGGKDNKRRIGRRPGVRQRCLAVGELYQEKRY
jgi:hypothetical protein